MPISPQQVAPPINIDTVGKFMADIDRQLSTPMLVSGAIIEPSHELYVKDLSSFKITVINQPLNASEHAYVCEQYVKAGWKECKVLDQAVEPGRGTYCHLVLRAIEQVVNK